MIKISTSLILCEDDMKKLTTVLELVWNEDLEVLLKNRRLFSFVVELRKKMALDGLKLK